MKYKLINKQTGVETLCDKVTIDEFDYYVSDELPSIGDKSVLQVEGFSPMVLTHFEECESDYKGKKIIASNNPIDIPNVVNEVEMLANIEYPFAFGGIGNIENTSKNHFIKGYNKSQETHPYSEEDMIEFASWCYLNGYSKHQINDRWYDGEHYIGNSKELLQLWKEQKIKIIYYND